MKRIKKLLAVMLTAIMVMSMGSMSVMADETTYTITINNSTDGYMYKAYQIFVGDLSDGILSNVKFGSALSVTNQSALLSYYSDVLTNEQYENSAAGLAAALTAEAITTESFAAQVATYIADDSTVAGTSEKDSSGYKIEVEGAGYYLIINTEVPTATGAEGYSSYILKVAGNVEVDPKNTSVPTADKSVSDVNDSTNTDAALSSSDSADYDIGDNVPFTLTAKMPASYAKYEKYALTFHDTLSNGLSLNSESIVVTVTTGDVTTTVVNGYSVETSSVGTLTDDSCTFEVQIVDTNKLYAEDGALIEVGTDSVITVTYTAKLLTTATYKETNEMYITYSNNPNGEGTGTSITDTTTVYTYTLTVTKTTDDGTAALSGAEFTLYKYDGTSYVAEGDAKSGTGEGSNVFTWSGLDDGKYLLKETKTPDGYNTMDDLYFTIEAEHEEEGITSLAIKDSEGTTISGVTGGSFTTSTNDGTITTTIRNYKGTEIPATGGIGTTIFYVVGAILVLGAAVILVTRRRMGNRA